jgi:transposase
MQCDNICAEEVVRFPRCIRWQLRRKLLVILDRGKVHRARVVQEYLRRLQGKIRLDPLPGYAPDLNPVEQVWNHTKYSDMANLAPENLRELGSLVNACISRTRYQWHLLRAFFELAGLSLNRDGVP